jgi:hypothetical protein
MFKFANPTLEAGIAKYLIIAALVSFWLALTYWRTLYLGFFSDDWILFTDTSISTSVKSYLATTPRPVYGVLYWAGNWVANGSAKYWQVISSLTIAINAIAVFGLLRQIYIKVGYSSRASSLGAAFGVVALVASPWAVAMFAWSSCVLTLWSLTLFCFGFLKIQRASPSDKLFGGTLILAAFLVYEAYWFAFVPLLVMTSDCRAHKARELGRVALTLLLLLSLALIYQRIAVPYLLDGQSKSASLENLTFILDKIFTWRTLFRLFSIKNTFALLVAVAICALILRTRIMSPRRLTTVVFAVSLGFSASAVVYAIAGYPMVSDGVMSRTMGAPSLYIAAGLGMVTTATIEAIWIEGKSAIQRLLSFIAVAAVLILLLIAFATRLSEWVQIQDQSRKVLHAISTAAYLDNLRPEPLEYSVVVVQIDGDPHGAIFGASWELSGGVASIKPSFVRDGKTGFVPAREGDWMTIWDGEKVVQRWCASPQGVMLSNIRSDRAPVYLRINPNTGTVLETGMLSKASAIGCQQR